MYTNHFLAATFHVTSAHLPCHAHALLCGDWCQSLGLQEVDTGTFRSQI